MMGGKTNKPTRSRSILIRMIALSTAAIWRTGVDWHSKRPLLTRLSAHLSIIVLALAAILLSGLGFPTPRRVVGDSSRAYIAASPAQELDTEPEATPLPDPVVTNSLADPQDASVVDRLPIPHTNKPDRPRAEVVTYRIQQGDTIFDIAARFGLSPNTIVWSNREALADAPWLIKPGLELFIPPVDGVFYTVREGDTLDSIAGSHSIETAALYNEWNRLEEDAELREGQLLILPGAEGDEIDWSPPPSYATSGASSVSYGVCSGVSFQGPGANGWFILPTGRTTVSGWYFHDVRNPTHIGLDYQCRLGEPLYAADNGVVTIAGWNGGYGILVEINHGNGFVTRYGHNSQLAVSCGDPVYQGQIIGYCGSTGWSTGPHLHYEIRYNGVPQDPQNYE
jgi:murein DD-endopeptidase MepM/ murein hydrolase activator NlpD